jgi:hypothetical protein
MEETPIKTSLCRKSDWDFELETKSRSSNRFQEQEVQKIHFITAQSRKAESNAQGINPIHSNRIAVSSRQSSPARKPADSRRPIQEHEGRAAPE